ncbi:formin BNI1-like [Juglans microcarpa x Juglans regia]|uniref:formin BNI1-like n=1 Tax=Juglans microcarpa x Juglans regia TaxID=2249226 RepID=UPI001B7E65B3|nr:formin BNI1-like [Juglans microcarpa x Juglans regia]
MAINRDPPPPPTIGKIGPYTVFMTPPSTPKPSQPPVFASSNKIVTPPPVQPPPLQFHKSAKSIDSSGPVVGFFKNAVTKVQNAHSSLDDHLARWFGLNQSKYQWALDDYHESKGLEKGDARAKDISSKVQSV